MKRAAKSAPPEQPEVGDWVAWLALALAAAYLAIHLQMLSDSLILWGGMLQALVLGQ